MLRSDCLDPLLPSPSLAAVPLPLPPLPLAAAPLDPWDPGHRWALGYSYSNSASRPPRIWTVILVFFVALIAGLVVGGMVPLIMVVAQKRDTLQTGEQIRDAIQASLQQPTILLTSGAATQIMLLLTALAAAVLSPEPVVRRLRLNRSTLSPVGYIVAPIGAFAISILFGAIVALLGIHENGTLKLLGEAFKHLTPTEVVFAVLIVGVMPGFAEEILFRGYIQTRLVARLGRWVGIGITAFLFGVMHMDPLQGSFAIGFGLYIGYLADKSGSIRPAMVCHAVNNSIQVILGRFLSAGGGEQMPRDQAAVVALVTAAVVALCTLYIYLRVRPPPTPDSTYPSEVAPAAVAQSAVA